MREIYKSFHDRILQRTIVLVRDDLPDGRSTTFNIVQSKISSNELFVHRINKIFKYFVKFKALTCLGRCRGKVHSPLNF